MTQKSPENPENAVTTEAQDGVLIVTINRPDKRNAVNMAVAEGITAALQELDESDDLAVGVLTGAGGTFSAGMDLKAFSAGERPVVGDRGLGGLTRAEVRKPLIAAVEGWALGGGLELALSCDLIVAAENARFGLPEVKRGLVAGEGGLFRLPRRLPHHVAMEVLLTGDPLPAERAERFGLVNQLTAAGGARDGAVELAGRVASNAPLALATVKERVRDSVGLDDATAFEAQNASVQALRESEDVAEGTRAFLEKRKPVWRGR